MKYINQLSEVELKGLAKNLGAEIVLVDKSKRKDCRDCIWLECFNEEYSGDQYGRTGSYSTVQHITSFEDFKIEELSTFCYDDVSKNQQIKFVKFMIGKFGEEYKRDYFKYIQEQKSKITHKMMKDFFKLKEAADVEEKELDKFEDLVK